MVIVGGGFAGLYAARALAGSPVAVTVVDRTNHHLFQPLLYQVAAAGLSAPEIAQPIRSILSDRPDITVLFNQAVDLDLEQKKVTLEKGALNYDHLVLALGGRTFEPMPGRPMREYVVLPAAVLGDAGALARWVRRGVDYAAGLPPKQGKAKAKPAAPKK